MTIQNINIENLKPSNINVRKVGNKNIDDLVPSIRANGLLQPLIVRKNCQGYEVIAGQRRYHALCKLAEEKHIDPVPCVILEEGNDAKALEASLAENFSRLPMDEIDQYKAFAALQKKGKSIEEIAAEFGLTELMVKRRLALGNLISPILNAYRKDKINIATLRSLTLATKQQQKDWWALFKSDDYTPLGTSLRNWLFGGNDIDTSVALFPLEEYSGALISDLFGDQVFFDDASAFWHLQNAVIAKKRQDYIGNGWQDVIILDVGDFFKKYEHIQASKKDGG
ncbi:MAG: ParB/RepB/Spo0J family partition protein, partial [Cohaesibacter sp.]|nr:ParB/RepB/Spo0J family partition protein [Cohaesibacter sp.]